MTKNIIDEIAIIGVPQDLGASRRGVDMGPSAIRNADLLSALQKLGHRQIHDYGNIHCHDFDQEVSHGKSEDLNPKLRYLPHIVDTCYHLKEKVEVAIQNSQFPLIIGGDHSITIGTLAGMKKLHDGKTGILWIDAHGDFNTPETTPSGNIHGQPFAVLTNRGDRRLTDIGPSPTVLEDHAVQIGARELDKGEIANLNDSQVTVFSMRDIDEKGMASIAREAIKIATEGVDYLHVSFDIDALDPKEAPGTGTTVKGGLTYREAHLLMEMVHDSGKLASMEILEVNPILDEKNRTAELAVGLICSALGSKII